MQPKREMYDEINAFIGAAAKALEMPEAEVAKAFERNEIEAEMAEDERGMRYVAVRCGGKTASIYQGAILHDESKSGD